MLLTLAICNTKHPSRLRVTIFSSVGLFRHKVGLFRHSVGQFRLSVGVFRHLTNYRLCSCHKICIKKKQQQCFRKRITTCREMFLRLNKSLCHSLVVSLESELMYRWTKINSVKLKVSTWNLLKGDTTRLPRDFVYVYIYKSFNIYMFVFLRCKNQINYNDLLLFGHTLL